MGILASLLLFASVLFHELAHSFIALRNNLPIDKITLFIFGGVANMSEDAKTPGVEFRVALAGPLASLFLMIFFYLFATLAEKWSGAYAVFSYVGLLNGILVFFNLIPGFPLDGGRLLRATMWHFTGNFKSSTRIASKIGKGFAFLLMVLGFLQVMSGNSFNGLWFIFIGYFLQNAAESSYRQVVIKELIADLTVEKVMTERVISVQGDITLSDIVHDYFVHYHFDYFPVIEEGRAVGIINMAATKEVPKDEWKDRLVRDIMDKDLGKYIVSPSESIDKVLTKMVSHNLGWFLVTAKNGYIVGILTRSDIIHLLEIKNDLDE